jgi:hypothetical protein
MSENVIAKPLPRCSLTRAEARISSSFSVPFCAAAQFEMTILI